jgi:hypothetical protein
MPEWIDFKEVKRIGTMEKLLAHYSVQMKGTPRPGQIKGDCPLPNHPPGSRDSFNVNLDRNCWQCFNPACSGFEGNALGFVMGMEGCDLQTAAQKIMQWCGPKREEAPNHGASSMLPSQVGSTVAPNPTTTEPKRRVPVWLQDKEKTRATEVEPGVRADNPSQPDSNASTGNGKGYMKEIDQWFYKLFELQQGESFGAESYWKRVKNGVKSKLIESYDNGRKATIIPSP